MKHLAWIFSLAFVACASRQDPLGPVVPENEVERKMIGLLQKFDRWDDDGDGQLDLAELTAGMKEAGAVRDPVKTMAFYDTNRNGKISLSEAQAGYSRAGEVKPLP